MAFRAVFRGLNRQKVVPLIDLAARRTYKPLRTIFASEAPVPMMNGLDGWPEKVRETHLSTLAARPQTAPWFSRAYGHQRWTQSHRAAESQGPQALVSLGGTSRLTPVTAIGRLKTRSEFVFVKGGTRFATPSLVLQARQRPNATFDPGIARFGFTATKRLGGAVVRNRARRRLKEAVRLTASSRAREGYDYVLIARGGAVQRPFTEVIKDLQRALIKVHEPSTGRRHRKPPSA